ncbi:MAG: hypothetical protein AB7Q81_10135 [Gammaproteobacteria bacterium]
MARSRWSIVMCLLAAGAPHDACAGDPHGRWMLMSRHGECEALDALERAVPDLPAFTDPAGLVERLEAGGHFVQARPLPGSAGRAYEVTVADLSLNLVLVRETLCARR